MPDWCEYSATQTAQPHSGKHTASDRASHTVKDEDTMLLYGHIHFYTHMCSVDTWLRPWASWEARFSSRQPSRQVTSSAILPLYRRLLVVVAGRGEGRGSWFNTEMRRKMMDRGEVGRKEIMKRKKQTR